MNEKFLISILIHITIYIVKKGEDILWKLQIS